MPRPYEKYETSMLPHWRWRCWVCGDEITTLTDHPIIVRRDGKHRHERCGGPPAPDKPPIATRVESDAKGGAAGNAQGRVVRKGNSLS